MIASVVNQVTKMATRSLNVLDNKYVMTFVRVFLVLYAGLVAPRLPGAISGLFNNSVFKVFILFLIAYTGVKDATIALLIAVGFTVSMVTLRKAETVDSIAGLVDAVIDGPQEVINELIDDGKDAVRKGVDAVQDVVPMIGSDDPAGAIIDQGQDIVEQGVNAVQGIANQGVDAAQGVVSGVVSAFGGIGAQAASVVQDAVGM